jgi:hypothetical protein
MSETTSRGLGRLVNWTGQQLSRWWIALIVLAGGAVAGSQFASPNKRVLQVVAAAIVVIGAIRLQSLAGLLILIPLLPFPKATTYGGTTFAFVLFVFLVWLGKVTLKIERVEGRSPMDVPVVLLVLAYLLSFSQIDSTDILLPALTNFFRALVYMAIAYLVVHLIKTEEQLRKILISITIMAVLVQLTALFELAFPATAIIPGWIDLSAGRMSEYVREGLEIKNMRVGGAFQDYELLAEFCGMIIILQWFLLMRAKGLWNRVGVSALLALSGFVLLATVTRGAIFSLAAATAYLLWMTRHRIRFHTLVIGVTGVLGVGFLLLNFVSGHTRSGNILDRLAETKFVSGVPDTRQGAWSDAWGRIWDSPILGHGPYFSHAGAIRDFSWPHCNYLFYWHITGVIGLAAFLFILWRLWKTTERHSPHMGHSLYSGALLLALRGMLIMFAVDQIKIDYIRNTTYPYWVWLFFGLIIATSRLAAQEKLGRSAQPVPKQESRRLRPPPISPLPVATSSPGQPGPL